MTNWPTLIAEIQAAGLNHPGIAREVNSKTSTIRTLAITPDRQPRHSLGESLKKLHKRVTKEKR